ncbi:MAG: hypothetical protein N2558_00870 [Patescibacteria group bacterium]|nr:hypothetical protein [Patescibacteria group bacterium]
MDLNQFLITLILFFLLLALVIFCYAGILLIDNLRLVKRILSKLEKTEELIVSFKDLISTMLVKMSKFFSNKKFKKQATYK